MPGVLDKPNLSHCHKSSFEETKEKQHVGKKVERLYNIMLRMTFVRKTYFVMTPFPSYCNYFLFL